MSAAHHQAKEGRLQVRTAEHGGIDVAPEVVDAGQGLVPGRRQPLPHAHPDQQAADQAGAAGDGDEVEVRGLDRGLLEGEVEEAGQPLEVVAGRQLGDDAAEVLVQVDLGVDDVGEDLAAVLDDRDRGLVAGRFDAQSQEGSGDLLILGE